MVDTVAKMKEDLTLNAGDYVQIAYAMTKVGTYAGVPPEVSKKDKTVDRFSAR